jgi:predicted RNA-binding protein with PIN domain
MLKEYLVVDGYSIINAWAEQLLILGYGAARVSAREPQEDVLEMKKSMHKEFINKNLVDKNLLEHGLAPNILIKLEKLRRNNDKA